MQTFELDAYVHTDNATLIQHSPAGRNAVDDFLVDGGAESLGKAVEALEGGECAFVAANKLLRGRVQMLGGHARTEDLAHQRERARHDPPRSGHDIDLARRLQGDHVTRRGPA